MSVRKANPEKPASEPLAEMAYRLIEGMIVARELPPGTMISESQLATQLKCGRTPIREALQRLRVEGYIDVHPRRGALVTAVDVLKQFDLLEIRRPLEILVARLASERATSDDRAKMLIFAEEIMTAARERDHARFRRANRGLHEVRVRAARNPMLAQHMRLIHGQAARFWYTYIEDTDSFDKAAALLAALLTAIVERKPDDACRASDAFLDFLEALTRQAINRQV